MQAHLLDRARRARGGGGGTAAQNGRNGSKWVDHQSATLQAKAKKKKRQYWLDMLDVRNCDLFGYEPDYTFPGYRSRFGAWMSVVLALAVLMRVATRALDYIYPEAVISENVLMFERDMKQSYQLPRFGVVFKRTGWKPFYDPTYFTFQFQQGFSGRASNSTYVDLGDEPCSFVDSHVRWLACRIREPCAQQTHRPGDHGDGRARRP